MGRKQSRTSQTTKSKSGGTSLERKKIVEGQRKMRSLAVKDVMIIHHTLIDDYDVKQQRAMTYF